MTENVMPLEDLSQEELDELVCEAKMAEAVVINNGGRAEQIAYLRSIGWDAQ